MSKLAKKLLKEVTGKDRLTFADILRAELDESDKYNVTTFAKAIRVSRTAVYSYLSGKSLPDKKTIRKICKIFGNYSFSTSSSDEILIGTPS